MQAAVLRARLPFSPRGPSGGVHSRAKYRHALAGVGSVIVPPELDAGHVYHLFPVRSVAREFLRAHLQQAGVESLVHYPIPIPEQPALLAVDPAECPIARRVCNEVFSLPLYPSLADSAIAVVTDAIRTGTAQLEDSAPP